MKSIFSKQKRSSSLSSQVERKRDRLLRFIQRENWEGLLREMDGTASGPRDSTSNRSVASDELSASTMSTMSTNTANEVLVKALLSLQPDKQRNALHAVCRLHPPVRVVRAIVSACPTAAEEIDGNGYTPLHAAAEWGASPQVIDYLIYLYPDAAAIRERNGKTPLHLCCECCCFDGASDSGTTSSNGEVRYLKGPLTEVVKALVYAAPQVINAEDAEGMSALEYAITFGADVTVVKTLQKASSMAWKAIAKNKEKKEMLKAVQAAQAVASPSKTPSAPIPVPMLEESSESSRSGEVSRASNGVSEMTPTRKLMLEYLERSRRRSQQPQEKKVVNGEADGLSSIANLSLHQHQRKDSMKAMLSKAA